MKALVTGAAGFIGSTLSDLLLAEGHEVLGVDCFTDYYDVDRKRDNLRDASAHPRFELAEADLRDADLDALLDGVDCVFHQAGQPGVRLSWADGFDTYADLNIKVTQRLLESARRASGLSRLVMASSSSVYGDADRYPVTEADLPRPRSPYGVTKLAAEHLGCLYASNHGVPTTSLRYFTVYGPRQRPDMATQRLVECAVGGGEFSLFGDGSQLRDFTYVSDIARANLLAAVADTSPGAVFNVSGGSSVSMLDLIATVERAAGRQVRVRRSGNQAGDVHRTGGDSSRARAALGWRPEVDLEAGVAAHVAHFAARIR